MRAHPEHAACQSLRPRCKGGRLRLVQTGATHASPPYRPARCYGGASPTQLGRAGRDTARPPLHSGPTLSSLRVRAHPCMARAAPGRPPLVVAPLHSKFLNPLPPGCTGGVASPAKQLGRREIAVRHRTVPTQDARKEPVADRVLPLPGTVSSRISGLTRPPSICYYVPIKSDGRMRGSSLPGPACCNDGDAGGWCFTSDPAPESSHEPKPNRPQSPPTLP